MILQLVTDYKQNIPLELLEIKYKLPIHEIVKILHAVTIGE